MIGFGENNKKQKLHRKPISMAPSIEQIINKAIKLQLSGNINEASKNYKYCLDNGINDPRVFCNYGLILRALGDLDKAQLLMEKSIMINPNDKLALNNLSGILKDLGKYNEAEDILKKCLKIDQRDSTTYNNLGTILIYQGKIEEAEIILKKAISINKNDQDVYLNLGILMRSTNKIDEAIKYTQKAIDIKPNNPEAFCNLGEFFRISGDYKKSIANYKKVLNLNESNTTAKFGLINCKGLICDWNNQDIEDKWKNDVGINGEPVNPYLFFLYDDNPINHLKRSKKYARKNFQRNATTYLNIKQNEKIRIGYFSADFRDHPVTHMLLSFLEFHDKNKFEIFLYSFGLKEDIYTDRLKTLGFNFKNIKNLNEQETVKLVRSDNLNIAIDLMGYTDKNRAIIFSNRLAPIQINYLGFPGTLGSKTYDYIIGDKIIIPKKDERFYIEKVVRLKHFFPPNLCARGEYNNTLFLRKDFNIPEDAFVFACFNTNKKITSKEFDVWMKILFESENSVLWLSKSNNHSYLNLQKEALKRNIDPNRIIFAERLKNKEEHLIRYSLSDLGLDTFNYNGHTTTSDALWSGLPVLTKFGKSFASRVSASILHSFNLNDLIVTREEEYLEKALFLSQNKKIIEKFKFKLKDIRGNNLLISQNYLRDLENLFVKLLKR